MATVKALVVAGGGGGGGTNTADRYYAGGGGAGGLVYNAAFTVNTGFYPITVGGGGNGSSGNSRGSNGSNSVFSTITAIGGGGGGAGKSAGTDQSGANGGSGGGAGANGGTTVSGGTATSGQGYNGGSCANTSVCGGGGGAGAVGTNGVQGGSSTGGVGLAYDISGTSTYYAGGGGGGNFFGYGGGGLGGGGNGGRSGTGTQYLPTAGTANTGGGGGGAKGSSSSGDLAGAAGGSGIVIIRYVTADFSSYVVRGGTKTTVGADTVHTFTSDGLLSITPTSGTKLTSIEAWGTGGNGYGGSSAGCGGGGGGAYAKLNDLYIDTTIENSFPIIIGTGVSTKFGVGTGVMSAASGSTQTDVGGIGGQASGSIGDIVYSGGNGGNGNTTGDTGGGGGGAAGPNGTGGTGGDGGTGTSTADGLGGVGNNGLGGIAGVRNTSPGGNSDLGGGGGGGGSNATSGTAGGSYGGGGGGGETGGGAGANGAVKIKYVTLNFPTCTGGTITTDGVYTINTFTSNGTFTVPAIDVSTVTTQAVTDITATTATGNGNVTSAGALTITERGVCWKTSTGPTTSDSKATSSGTTGAFTAAITGLANDTTYYVRAYAVNALGTSYGSEVTFQTAGKPTVTTQSVSAIDLTTAVFNGNVTSQNGYVVSERGFCYKTSTGPTTSDSKVVVAGTTGAYVGSPTGLPNGTLYYVRAYATNVVGTNYGAEVTFTTLTAGDKQLIKDISGVQNYSYSVSVNVGGTTGTVTIKLGTTGSSQIINAGAGVTVVTGVYSGLSGLIFELSEGADATIDDVYWVKLLGGEEVIDWDLDQYTSYIPIDSSVKFKRVEDKELTRFDMYRYLDAEFKDLDGYVTLTITEEANDKSQNRNKTFVVGNETGVLSPFVKKRISMLSKNQALVIQFSNAKLSETFTICQYQLTGFKESRKLYKLSKIISI